MKDLLTQKVPAIDVSKYVGEGPIADSVDVREIVDSFYSSVSSQQSLDDMAAETADLEKLITDVKGAMTKSPEGQLATTIYGEFGISQAQLDLINADPRGRKNWWDTRDIAILEGVIADAKKKHQVYTFENRMMEPYSKWVAGVVWADVMSAGTGKGSEGEEGEVANIKWGGDMDSAITPEQIADNTAYRVEQLGDKQMMANMTDTAGVETQRQAIAGAIRSAPTTMKLSEAVFQALTYQNYAFNAGDIAPAPLNRKEEQRIFGDKNVTQLRETHEAMYKDPAFRQRGRDSWPGPVRNYLPLKFNELSFPDKAILIMGATIMLSSRGKISLKNTEGTAPIKSLGWSEGYGDW